MRPSLSARVVAGGVALAAIVGLVFAVLIAAIGDQRTTGDRAHRAQSVIASATEAEKLSVDLETGLRGYQITRSQRFLAPWRTARAELPGRLVQLSRLTESDGSDEAVSLAAARAAGQLNAYVRDYAEPLIARIDRHRLSRAAEAPAAAEGKARFDALRSTFDGLIAAEGARATRHNASAGARADRAVTLGVVGLAICLALILLFVAYLYWALVRPVRLVAGAARRLEDGELSARVPMRREPELGDLAGAFNSMAESLTSHRDELESQNAELAAQQSELERAVEELAAGKERIERFEEFGRRVASQSDLEPLADEVLGQLADMTGATRGTLYAIRAPHDKVAHLLAFRGVGRSALPATVGSADGLPGRAIEEGRTVAVAHDGLHEIAVPLFLGDRVIGAVTLARGEDRAFARVEILSVEYLSRQIAVGIANAVSLRDARRQAAINRAVLETATDAFISADTDGRITAWNRSAEATFGWSRNEAIGRSLAETIVPPALREDFAGGLRAFVETGASSMMNKSLEQTAVTRHGTEIPVELTISPLMLDGEWTFNAFVRDVSDRAEAERLKDEFFALVSHELRTPLTSIIGYLELVLEESERIDPDTAHFLAIVERNGRRLQRLVGDLLFVAQVEAGKLSIHEGTVDLTSAVADCVEAARPRAAERGIDLSLDAGRVPAAEGDGGRIGQALDNLVSNAIKFTPEGGSVHVELHQDGDQAVIAVRDTGMGIPAGERDRLFERFFRSSEATERAIPGVGLGLTIVKAIVDAHGGSVSVDSAESKGTTFTVRLPVGAKPAGEIAVDPGDVAIRRISR